MTTPESAIEALPISDDWTRKVAPLARLGWGARGLSYALVGGLAMALAVGVFAQDADQKGALRLVAEATGGSLLLLLLGVGLGLFAIWEATYLVVMKGLDAMTWLDRLGKVIGIFFYGSLALSAIQLAIMDQSSGSTWTVERLSATALGYPLGQFVLVVAGAVVAAIAFRRGRTVFTGEFSEDLKTRLAGEKETNLIQSLGRIGEAGRSASFVLIALFLIVAGWQGQASEAGGLDSTLRQTTQTLAGSLLVGVTGIGFVAYGLFCIASARHRRMPAEIAS